MFDEFKVVIRADKRSVGEHERLFNIPEVNTIYDLFMAIYYTSRDIFIERRREGLQYTAETLRSYDALQYPLIFIR